jgi:hypothetical protein
LALLGYRSALKEREFTTQPPKVKTISLVDEKAIRMANELVARKGLKEEPALKEAITRLQLQEELKLDVDRTTHSKRIMRAWKEKRARSREALVRALTGNSGTAS